MFEYYGNIYRLLNEYRKIFGTSSYGEDAQACEWFLISDFDIYLHFSKTSSDEPLDVHLCSYFHEQHCVTRRDVIQT